ncbi:MAG: S1C family serine protease [Nitrospirota bacterium]
MKKLISLLIWIFVFSNVAFASTVYLPTDDSDEYLPTVKIFAYSMGYDGSLVAEAYGSGTLIDSKGTILTNNHVIENYWDPASPNDAFQICLTKSNDTNEPICEFTASLITRDTDKDLALLKIDSKDVSGGSVSFDFYLPYNNSSDCAVGDTVTVIGYPDTGGRTITYTSGLISGFLTEGGVKYIKTDADVSFGNSGGTAVDGLGNFIGVPTYVVGSYSYEVLGYLFPVSEIVNWIGDNKNDDVVRNEVADAALKDAMVASITANETGIYKNDYPPYRISLVDGWKFGNSLEGSFDSESYGSYSGSSDVVIFPVDRGDTSQLYVEVSVTDYSYEVTLDDIEYILGDYADVEAVSGHERVDFNGKYSAVKETYSYYDWWYYQNINTVTYYIPYGDKVINVLYGYTDGEEDRIDEVEGLLESFEVDMSKVESSVVDKVESKDPQIEIANTIPGVYLSDDSYEYDGTYYFGASFGKKDDYNFAINIYSNEYFDDIYVGNFEKFKNATLDDASQWYDVVAQGNVEIDGHQGFYYTDEYDDGYGYQTLYTTVYVESDDDTYFSIYYSAEEDSYKDNLGDFRTILKSIKLSNGGNGKYTVPSFSTTGSIGGILSDINNYVYEDSIRNLNSEGAFGDNVVAKFNPAGPLTREDFVVWAVRTLQGTVSSDFVEFEENYDGCGEVCFVDYDYSSGNAVYIDFARSVGAIGGKVNGTFSPDLEITLMAALKIIFELYDYDIWDAPDFVAWYMPYLQLGYKENVIPYGVESAGYLLTRGEGAYIIDGVMYGFGDYYDDYWY